MTSRTELLQDEYLRREGSKVDEFRYFYPDGTELTDQAALARIARLAVPPAYQEVFVSPDPDAELQAFGRDAAGRLQYRYHPDFLQAGALRKWQRLARFAFALPQLRQLTTADLRRAELPPRKVLALMTRLLYVAHFRVGSDAYATRHKTYGLSTLHKRHVKVVGNTVEFHFKGKHGIWQHKALTDRTLAANIEKLLALPGRFLFQARGEQGVTRVRSAELNAYIRELIGPFTAKDFRTWGGTLLAGEYLAEAGVAASEREARKTVVECVKVVAADLGNTPAVVRAHYICPVIFDRYFEGRILDDFEPRSSRGVNALEGLSRSELALQRMLDAEHRPDGRPRRAARTPSKAA
ncbi:DNA topoisomerase IB [Deinococcus peraridilitoris]|uniref:Topoisomerase IB n=1 Tax=Deinococcus peraridilitoris (strain DSM 19664 / LMG 22246 / CIP 109416 / KR-200) TaxID=937777 RepID=L0A292_DEIPD|nr:DNA topoisomerase IB [Deinococcus peraridilitoris]AFZ67971.1 topoisomerase IB [Deinococcus peraridilitoris DSM 19664]